MEWHIFLSVVNWIYISKLGSQKESICVLSRESRFVLFILNGRWKPHWVVLIREWNQIRETKQVLEFRLIDKGIKVSQFFKYMSPICNRTFKTLSGDDQTQKWMQFLSANSKAMSSLIQAWCGTFNLKIFSLNLLSVVFLLSCKWSLCSQPTKKSLVLSFLFHYFACS